MNAKMRAWWADRQGLGGMKGTARDVLDRSGWARSVGGANPYVAVFARSGGSFDEVNTAVDALEICELPSARGCTHVIPADDYALALKVGQGTSDVAPIRMATKHLGVTEAELGRLNQGVLDALATSSMDPKQLREALGDKVRNLGEEGKKRGQATTLPLATGWLQSHGYIRRIPATGRLDSERYRYCLWKPNPLDAYSLSKDEALTELARKYWTWIGPARLKDFQWFSGLGVGASKQIVEPLHLEPVEDDFLILPEHRAAYDAFEVPDQPCYRLVASIDSILLHRRDARSLVDAADAHHEMRGERSLLQVGGVEDVVHHAILDRGRLIGFWEFDPEQGQLVWTSFAQATKSLRDEVAKVEAFARDQLGDVRSFSLDSPASRKPKIDFLRSQMP